MSAPALQAGLQASCRWPGLWAEPVGHGTPSALPRAFRPPNAATSTRAAAIRHHPLMTSSNSPLASTSGIESWLGQVGCGYICMLLSFFMRMEWKTSEFFQVL